MQILQLLLQLIPGIINIAREGQEAWEHWIAARALEAGPELDAAFAALRAENVRMLILAEHRAGGGEG